MRYIISIPLSRLMSAITVTFSRQDPRRLRVWLAAFLLSVLAGCTITQPERAADIFEGATLPSGGKGPLRVLLMPPDIECYELTAGGLLEPSATWTEQAKRNVAQALDELLEERRADLVTYDPAYVAAERAQSHGQIMRLQEAVGISILGQEALPTKRGGFDWSLGEGVQALGADFDADYALFVFLRDSYASAGRKTMMVFGAMAGIAVPLGERVGFASLVDLDTGKVLWFNRLFSQTGDLRRPEPAADAVAELMTGCPL
jgi:hypothetical protein